MIEELVVHMILALEVRAIVIVGRVASLVHRLLLMNVAWVRIDRLRQI
jgi:hypothetical protein